MKRPTAPQVLLILAALLTPIIGGYVASDQTTIDPSALIAGLGEGQGPILQHAILALPVFLALTILLVQRRVQQIPHPFVATALVMVVAGLAPAVAVSSYRAVAVNVWVEWMTYAVAFLAVISGLGRRVGPMALLAAIFIGTVYIARMGVFEYLEMRRLDPNWRVFCGWSNPNAAAAMLTLGFLVALGFPASRERSTNLLINLGVVLGGGLVLCALLLTGSKGGTLLALPTGLVVFGLIGGKRTPIFFIAAGVVLALCAAGFLFLKSFPYVGVLAALAFVAVSLWPHRIQLARLAAAFAFAGLTLAFFSSTSPSTSRTTSASRIGSGAATQDQSSTFRINLWKSAAKLGSERPLTGWGLGSYRYESARPGLATATVFSHNSYLQLFAEAGIGALLLFFGFLGLWARRSFRGSSRLPEAQRLPFAAAVGGVAAILAHCLVDSDLSYFGLGLSFFLVLGTATVLAADAVAPEFVPRQSRFMAAGGVMVAWLLFAYLAEGDLAKSKVRFAQAQHQPADLASIEGLAAWDGDAAYLWALGQPPAEAEIALKRAYTLQPTPKVARTLARYQELRGDFDAAEASLFPALAHDRLNLPTLNLLMQIQLEGDSKERATETARRIVAVEQTPYFQIRSLDELIPTETYLARIVLAESEKDPTQKATLLADAARGIERYAAITVPQVVRAAKTDPQARYAGESLAGAQEKLAKGADAAKKAALLYRQLGAPKSAAAMDEAAKAMAEAISPAS